MWRAFFNLCMYVRYLPLPLKEKKKKKFFGGGGGVGKSLFFLLYWLLHKHIWAPAGVEKLVHFGLGGGGGGLLSIRVGARLIVDSQAKALDKYTGGVFFFFFFNLQKHREIDDSQNTLPPHVTFRALT